MAVPPPPPPPPAVGSPLKHNGGIYNVPQDDIPKLHQALYDFAASQPDDLPLTKGEIIHCLVMRDDGWNQGINSRGQVGYYPQGYATFMPDQTSPFPKARLVYSPSGGLQGVTLFSGGPVIAFKVSPDCELSHGGLTEHDAILEVNGEPCADQDISTVTHMVMAAGPSLRLCVLNIPSK